VREHGAPLQHLLILDLLIAVEACEACDRAVDLALIASGDIVPAACDGQCGVVGALGIGTKWGN